MKVTEEISSTLQNRNAKLYTLTGDEVVEALVRSGAIPASALRPNVALDRDRTDAPDGTTYDREGFTCGARRCVNVYVANPAGRMNLSDATVLVVEVAVSERGTYQHRNEVEVRPTFVEAVVSKSETAE